MQTLHDKSVEEPLASKLSKFVTQTRFTDLPSDVVEITKLAILDTVASAIGGLTTDSGRIALDFVRDIGGKPESSIMGVADKTSCTNAAFVNTQLGNALDLDDVATHKVGNLRLGIGHITNDVLWPALALAERSRASGSEFITAVALGYDVAHRIGASLDQMSVIDPKTGKSTFSQVRGEGWIAFGSLVAAGKILGLSDEEMANGFGIVGYTTTIPSHRKFTSTVPISMVKYGVQGWKAQLGVTAALMAKRGFTGDTTVLDGELGFWKFNGSTAFDIEKTERGLGSDWRIRGNAFKPYPSCRGTHTCLDVLTKIVEENNLGAEDIDSIVVYSYSLPKILTDIAEPHNIQCDNQFSIPYGLALVAYRVKPGPEWQSPDMQSDPRIQRFIREKVRVEKRPPDPTRAGYYPSIEIRAKGKTFEETPIFAKGDPDEAAPKMTPAELENKFRTWTYEMLPSSKVEQAIETARKLERLGDVTEFTQLLS